MAIFLDFILTAFKLIVAQWKLALACLFLVLFCFKEYQYKHKVDEFEKYKVSIAEENRKEVLNALNQTIAIQQQKDDAENKYEQSIKVLQADKSKLSDSVSGLSKQLATTNKKLSSLSKDSCIQYSYTQSDILTRSSEEYSRMAGYADEERAERLKLVDLMKAGNVCFK